MLWNPVANVKDAWSKAATIWGKVATIVFYSYIWLLILANVWQYLNPLSMGYDCLVDNADPISSSTLTVESFIQCWSLALIFWALYVENAGLTLGNISTFFIMMSLGAVLGMWWTIPRFKAAGIEDTSCIESLLGQEWIYMVPIAVALASLYMEKRATSGTPGETQSLV